MTTVAQWAEHPQPIEATASIGVARRRFLDDPTLSALPVVEKGCIAGLLHRDVVLATVEADPTAGTAGAKLMALARSVPADAAPAEVLAELMAEGAGPVVLTHAGAYAGMITPASLLAALQGRSEPDARENEQRRQFMEMLAREVRAPMTGVLAVAELLQRQPLSADAQAYVGTIVSSTENLLRLLGDALDLALGETGRLEPRPEPVALRATMDEIQAAWQQGPSADVAVLVSYDGDPDLGAMVDGVRLRQVFNNLISAAVKTTRQGAVEASLVARAMAEGVRLVGRVRDAGPGLPPERLARIFEPMAPSQDARAGWAGLGPALCRRIVEAMHGSIRAESNIGEGVTVTFELLAPELEQAKDPEIDENRPARGVHVLVVDDNATNRMVAEGLCEMFDCTSECAEDGEQAVEAARSGRFDIILMDIKMPRMDGLEATRVIRSLPGALGQVPIIALTANADPEDAKTYLACGMSSVVEKPIKPERLLTAMKAALEGAEANQGAVRAA
jgi:signal transduction histidine kinase/ActR/RegA family two-component response regulator